MIIQNSHKRSRVYSYHRHMSPAAEILIHIIAVAVSLVVFALAHHVIGYAGTGTGITTVRSDYTVLPQADTAMDVPEAETPETGDFSAKFPGIFISGDPQVTETSYRSENLSIGIETRRTDRAVYYVADIYIRDISCLTRVLAYDTYGRNLHESISKTTARTGAVLTINGDYYSVRDSGVVMANGILYLDGNIYNDICVMYWDGSVKCFAKDEFDCEREVANGAYQMWNFGPALLDGEGQPLDTFPGRYDDISDRNPRSVLGYYEPGHYCLICVDGRSSVSRGMNLKELSQLAYSMGLTQAYNLDGGRTSELCYGETLVNIPAAGGRGCSDYICIMDAVSK